MIQLELNGQKGEFASIYAKLSTEGKRFVIQCMTEDLKGEGR